MVKDMDGLRAYERFGHSAIMGIIHRRRQYCDTILGCFGKRRKRATEKYEQFIEEGGNAGRRTVLVVGGVMRSLGGWSQVLSIKRAGSKIFSDERILGSS
ncbi:MAG: transposase, partial [Thermodesulfobacteriota bacterium]|nr:transposase [Thermodesulfobacteriota bacterium]